MVRVAIGFFILFGAIGHDDIMIGMGQPQPFWPLLIKLLIGMLIMGWGLWSINKRGIDNV